MKLFAIQSTMDIYDPTISTPMIIVRFFAYSLIRFLAFSLLLVWHFFVFAYLAFPLFFVFFVFFSLFFFSVGQVRDRHGGHRPPRGAGARL